MKKFIAALFALLALSAAALAAEPVAAEKYGGKLTLNTIEQDGSEYYVYRNIVYIPLDDYHRAVLGVDVSADGLKVTSRPSGGEFIRAGEKAQIGELTEETRPVALNGLPASPDYPFLRSGEVLLLPLTWDNASAIGWTLPQGVNGIKVFADSRFEIYTNKAPENTWPNSDDDFIVVKELRAAKVREYNNRFFSGRRLYIYSGEEYEDIMSKNYTDVGLRVPFGSFQPENLEINGNELTVTAYTYLTDNKMSYLPDHAAGSDEGRYSEVYEARFDIDAMTLTDTRLLKKRWFNELYGSFEEDDGSIKWDLLTDSEAMFGTKSYFQYDGGRVILNGSMMRSYSAMIYKVTKYRPDGGIESSGASRDNYWICAEDLENYGYDMAVDYENRATYFTRNPDKPINPMSLDGTNEHIAVVPSDWKIYIDGREPKQYFNIGGYTMIKAGELGEWEDGSLDDGYHVCFVTTPDMEKVSPKVVGYYSADVFDEPVENLRTEYLTDVMYAFILPEADGSLTVPRPETLKAVVKKAHADGVRVHASIGGWGTAERLNVTYFEQIAKSPELTRKFIENCVLLARTYNLDGVEIDWEHPNASTADLYEDFMLKVCADTRLPSVSASLCGCGTDGTPVSASAAVSDKVIDSLDFINVMCYDTNDADHSPYAFSESSLRYWLGRGAPREKLILGIPLYARPSFWQYRQLREAGFDVEHSDFAQTPYSVSYYNSLDTIKRKINLAKDIGGGVMFFDIHEDTADETSAARAAWEILCPIKTE